MDPEDVFMGGFLGLILSLFAIHWKDKQKKKEPMEDIEDAVADHAIQVTAGK